MRWESFADQCVANPQARIRPNSAVRKYAKTKPITSKSIFQVFSKLTGFAIAIPILWKKRPHLAQVGLFAREDRLRARAEAAAERR